MFGKLQKYFHERKHGKNIYLIYSMGKVGSSTVTALIEKQFPFVPVFQLHFLSDHWIKEVLPALPVHYHGNLAHAQNFFEFRNQHPDYRIKIITLVREPVIRDISDVFENWQDFFKTKNVADVTFEKVMNRLTSHDFEYTLNWFDTEFKAWTGIDIYEQKFDKERGYSAWNFDAFDILCIKLEKLDQVLAPAIMEFGGLHLKTSGNANVSAQKNIRDLYKRTVDEFRLSEVQQALIFDSALVNHFYSTEEIAKLKIRWTKASKIDFE